MSLIRIFGQGARAIFEYAKKHPEEIPLIIRKLQELYQSEQMQNRIRRLKDIANLYHDAIILEPAPRAARTKRKPKKKAARKKPVKKGKK